MKTSTKDHSVLASRYMQVLAVELAVILEDHGVSDPETRRKIVESFLFGMAVGWDQYYVTDFATGRAKARPAVCFRFADGEFVVPDGQEEFHEWAPFQATASIFDPDNPDSDLDFVYDNGINGEVPYSKQLRSSE